MLRAPTRPRQAHFRNAYRPPIRHLQIPEHKHARDEEQHLLLGEQPTLTLIRAAAEGMQVLHNGLQAGGVVLGREKEAGRVKEVWGGKEAGILLHSGVRDSEEATGGDTVGVGAGLTEEAGVGEGLGEDEVLRDGADTEAGHVTAHCFVEGSFDQGAGSGKGVDIEAELSGVRGGEGRGVDVGGDLGSDGGEQVGPRVDLEEHPEDVLVGISVRAPEDRHVVCGVQLR